MKRTKEQAEETRRQLLEAAKKVFATKGFGATRLSDIAKEAGMTRGAIYWHFKDKKEMLLTLAKEEVDPFFEIIYQIMNESLNPVEKIKKFLLVILEQLNKDKSFLCNLNLNFIELNLRNELPEIKSYMHQKGEDARKVLINLIKEGIKMGELKNVNTRVVTDMINALISGYLLMAEDGEITIDLHPESIVEIFLNGLKT